MRDVKIGICTFQTKAKRWIAIFYSFQAKKRKNATTLVKKSHYQKISI